MPSLGGDEVAMFSCFDRCYIWGVGEVLSERNEMKKRVGIWLVVAVVMWGCGVEEEPPAGTNGDDVGGDDVGVTEDVGASNTGEPDVGEDVPGPVEIRFPEDEFIVERASPTRPQAEVIDDEGEVVVGASIQWASADPAILEITSGGMALGHQLGETELIATHGDLEARWPARVVGVRVDRVVVVPAESTIPEGWELPYSVTYYDAANAPIEDDRPVAWSTSDESVATVSGDGVVSAVGAGEVEVVATVDGVEGKGQLVVEAVELVSVAISPSNPGALPRGGQLQLEVTAFDLDGQDYAVDQAQWTSSDPSVATVDETGLVEGIASGEATIEVDVDGLVDSVEVDVVFGIQRVALGEGFACAVGGARLHCWGANDRGQLGNGTFEDADEPTASLFDGQVVDLSLGEAHGCLVDDEGDIYCWGASDHGQAGQDGGEVSAPTLVEGDGSFSGLAGVDAGTAHTCAHTSSGQVACWGANDRYQLGNQGAATHQPQWVSTGEAAVQVVAGNAHSCQIAAGGQARCWGDNQREQLGGGTSSERSSSASAVIGGYNFASISASGDFTCGVSSNGPPACWGANDRGQLGMGNTTDQDVPISLDLQAGESLLEITTGSIHACGRLAGGQLRCWGAHDDGRLGLVTDEDEVSPRPVDTELVFNRIAAGGGTTCGRTPDHELYCWGKSPASGVVAQEVAW